jgi:predicted alpha/beta-fold hydrolase
MLTVGLKQYIRNHLDYFKSSENCGMDLDAVMNSKNVKEFDTHCVVPVHGFDDVDHYYAESSACRRSHNIKTPTLAISADDDPVCSAEGCPSIVEEFGRGLVVVRSAVGGHVGFGTGFFPGTASLMDTAACDWFDACKSIPEKN